MEVGVCVKCCVRVVTKKYKVLFIIRARVCCVHVPCWCCAMLSRYSRMVLARVSWLEVESRYRLTRNKQQHGKSPRLASPRQSPARPAAIRLAHLACLAAPRLPLAEGRDTRGTAHFVPSRVARGPQRITSPSTSLRLAEAWAPKAWGQSDSNGCLRSRRGKGRRWHESPRSPQTGSGVGHRQSAQLPMQHNARTRAPPPHRNPTAENLILQSSLADKAEWTDSACVYFPTQLPWQKMLDQGDVYLGVLLLLRGQGLLRAAQPILPRARRRAA